MDAAQEIGELRIDARSQMNFAHLTGDHNPVQVDVAVGRQVRRNDHDGHVASGHRCRGVGARRQAPGLVHLRDQPRKLGFVIGRDTGSD